MANILLVDDSQSFRSVLKKELDRGGYESLMASNGQEALALLERFPVSLVFADVHMPKLDGYALCAEIRRRNLTIPGTKKSLPVILVTSDDALESRMMGFEAGATEYLSKSFSPGEIVQLCDQFLCPEKRFSNVRALIVDDNRVSRMKVIYTLKKNGMETLEACDGQEALNVLKSVDRPVDLVVTDLEMPVMNGYQLCREIRKGLKLKELPVVFLTAHTDQNILLGLFKAGATDYLTKPFVEAEFLARLEVSLNAVSQLRGEKDGRLRAEGDLKKSQELIEASVGLADKAEVASAVIHNIGNVMNSINISNTTLHEMINQLPVGQLQKALQMLEANLENLGSFLIEDPRGKLLPLYLIRLGREFPRLYQRALEELDEMEKKLSLARGIIRVQQTYSRQRKGVTSLCLQTVLEGTLSLQPELLAGVDVVRRYESVEDVLMDETELTHILINLLKNAYEAMDGCIERRMSFVIENHPHQSNKVRLRVSDSGTGISAEHLGHMFTHGFTTKSTGHGFGLSYCAKVMANAGGGIKVFSEGLGKGTEFVLDFVKH